MITCGDITRGFEAAVETGASCLVSPVTDTIKRVDGRYLVKTIDRDMLRAAVTPQTFRLALIKEAFQKTAPGESFTDECALLERFGHKIVAVEGRRDNIKITVPEDLDFVRRAIEEESDG